MGPTDPFRFLIISADVVAFLTLVTSVWAPADAAFDISAVVENLSALIAKHIRFSVLVTMPDGTLPKQARTLLLLVRRSIAILFCAIQHHVAVNVLLARITTRSWVFFHISS